MCHHIHTECSSRTVNHIGLKLLFVNEISLYEGFDILSIYTIQLFMQSTSETYHASAVQKRG